MHMAIVVLQNIKMCAKYFKMIIKSLKTTNTFTFVNVPNTDPGNKAILEVIEENMCDSNFHFFKNMIGQNFISLFKNANFIIGKSSAGILEAPSIPIPAINVGDRQKGRIAADNVIYVKNEYKSICLAINEALSTKFIDSIRNIKNPYGEGESTEKVMQYLKTIDFKKFLRKTEDPLVI